MWICETKVAMSCLTLALDTTSAMCENIKDEIVMLLSCWDLAISFFALLDRLNENWPWKMSMTLESGLSSELRGEKDGKILYNLLYESTRWPLMEFFWWLVSELIEWRGGLVYVFGVSSMRVLIRWLFRRVAEQSWDLLASLWRWSLMGMRPAIALSPLVGEVLNAPSVKIEESGLDLFYFTFHFYFSFDLFFYFLFLEQLGLGLISHAVTSVTTWWRSHKTDHETWYHIQVHLSRNNVSAVEPFPNHTSLPSIVATFLQHILWRCCNSPDIPSSMAEILLFNSVFYDGVTPVSVSTLKPPLRVIGVLPLKLRASPIISVCI